MSFAYRELRKQGKAVGKIMEKGFKKTLRDLDKIATRDTYKSIRHSVRAIPGGLKVSIGAAESMQEIIDGKDPNGKWPNEANIIRWMRARRIVGRDNKGRFMKTKTLAFLIRRKIARDGIEPVDIIGHAEKIFTVEMSLKIDEAIKKDIDEQIRKSAA